MRLRARLAATGIAALVLAAGCQSGPASVPSPAPPQGPISPPGNPPPAPGKETAAEALKKLCKVPQPGGPSGATPEGTLPAAVAEVEHQVEEVRGLRFVKPVLPQPVSQATLVKKLDGFFKQSFPNAYYERRSRAWQTIGVIPRETSIKAAERTFQTGQVIGFYVPETGQLFFIGSTSPTPIERLTLAHELTHAIDDQHFNLDRLDVYAAKCEDERSEAATALVEGSAQYFSLQVATTLFSLVDRLRLAQEAVAAQPPTGDVPPFIEHLAIWPYTGGLAFVTQLESSGGLQAVNEALKHPPVSTEQILHPDRYPKDRPVPVDVPDYGPSLGKGWSDLDVQGVGEEWLREMLLLRLGSGQAGDAAAGWGGGIYRAWSKGDHTAVVLATTWDTPADESQFLLAMQSWIKAGQGQQAFVTSSRKDVTVGFASDAPTLAKLRAAL